MLGASNYTYAEATWTRSLPDWIGSHTRSLAFFGGSTRLIVPDQWKVGVDKPCYWDPELNRTYQEWAMRNAVAIVPARPGHARDKAKVEQGVLLVQRWIVAALRKRQFFSLAHVNGAIAELYQKLDRPALQLLPARPYVFAQWKKERVRLDYHVDVDGHYYSVPYQLAQQPVEIRYTATTVEVLYRGKRVASHMRSWEKPGTTTETSHQPKSHQRYREWTPTRLLEWAEATGPFTRRLVEAMLVVGGAERRGHFWRPHLSSTVRPRLFLSSIILERSSPSRVRFAAPNYGAPLTAAGRSEEHRLRREKGSF